SMRDRAAMGAGLPAAEGPTKPGVPSFRPDSPLARGPALEAAVGAKIRPMLPPYLREARKQGEAAQAARPGERKPGGTPGDAAKAERARTAEVAAPASGPATGGLPAPGLAPRAKGKGGARARHGKLERLAAAQPIRPPIAAAPEPQTGGVAIGRDRLLAPSTD